MPKKTTGGNNTQLYNTQGLIVPGSYTHTIASTEIMRPIFANTGGAKKKKPKPKPKPKNPTK